MTFTIEELDEDAAATHRLHRDGERVAVLGSRAALAQLVAHLRDAAPQTEVEFSEIIATVSGRTEWETTGVVIA